MNLERIKTLAEAYGANPARWPAAERADAEAFLAAEPAARLWLEEAASIDRVLDAAETQKVTRALEDRILAHLPEPRVARAGLLAKLSGLMPGGWAPASALACSLVLGLAVGATLPGMVGLSDPQAADPALLALGDFDEDAWGDLGDGT
jgi:hypothetical protein